MRRRGLIASLALPPLAWIGGCSVDVTRVDGADAPSFTPTTTHPKLALVLAAGGPRGFAHVGVVRALKELQVEPDLVVGASVGALIGSALAAGLGIERIESLAFDFDFYRLARWSPSGGVQMDGSKIAALVRESLRVRSFGELKISLAVVATDVQSGSPVVFNQGDLGYAVQASCAIPGRFAPVRIRGRDTVDADVSSPLPVKTARRLGARQVLAVDVAVHMDRPRPAGAEKYIEGDRIKRAQIDAEARLADLVLHPYFGYWVNLSREYRETTARAAYEQTMQQAAAIVALAKAPA